MKVPAGLNLVRLTGLLGPARLPAGFVRSEPLSGDHQRYAVREGFLLDRCPNVEKHGFYAGCPTCDPYHGAIAVPVAAVVAALRTEIPVEHRAKSSGRLGTPDRNHTCEACGGLGEVSIYPCKRCGGSGELSSAMARQVVLSGPSGGAAAGLSDAALRKRLAADRSLGRIGRKR